MSSQRQYSVSGVVGSGGHGTVYRATLTEPSGFSKAVALKIISDGPLGTEDLVRRLRDEAKVLGMVRHRAIVHVDGLTLIDGRWAVVMEYIDGVDLRRIGKLGPMPIGPACEILAETAGALDVAFHAKGPDGSQLRLLHRDIKPSNLILTAAGEVKIVDFGIARADLDTREAETSRAEFGTPRYMAPERLDGRDAITSDVYSLGAVLYELLSGEPLGRTTPHPSRHAARRTKAVERIQTVASASAAELLGDLLEYAPGSRPAASEVARRCARLAAREGHITLREWSAEAIGRLRENEPQTDDPQQSQPLSDPTRDPVDRGDATPVFIRTDTSTKGAASPLRGGFSLAQWAPAIITTAAVCIALAVFLGRQDPLDGPAPTDESPEQAAESIPPEVEPVVPPAPPAPPPPAAEAEAVATEPPTAQPTVAPSPRPEPRPPAPTRRTARVDRTGDAQVVWLVRDGERVSLPGEVAVGRWSIEANFGNGVVGAGSIEVVQGRTSSVDCNSLFARCSTGP